MQSFKFRLEQLEEMYAVVHKMTLENEVQLQEAKKKISGDNAKEVHDKDEGATTKLDI